MADEFEDWRAFVAVARAASFSEGARQLRTTTPTLSRRVKALEDRLGVRLLQRTTRLVALTDAGRECLARAEGVLADLEDLEAVARGAGAAGDLRITAPVAYVQEGLMGLVPAFLRANPEVRVHIETTDRFVSLVEEGFDLAVRIGQLGDSTLQAAPLGVVAHAIVASPRFLAGGGPADTPAAVQALPWVVDTNHRARAVPLQRGDEQVVVRPRGPIAVNGAHAVRTGLLCDLGVAYIPEFVVRQELERGELIRLLPEWRCPAPPIHALWPARPAPRKVRAFVEHLRAAWPG